MSDTFVSMSNLAKYDLGPKVLQTLVSLIATEACFTMKRRYLASRGVKCWLNYLAQALVPWRLTVKVQSSIIRIPFNPIL